MLPHPSGKALFYYFVWGEMLNLLACAESITVTKQNRIIGSKVTKLQITKIKGKKPTQTAKLKSYKLTNLQRYKASKLPSYKSTELPSFQVTEGSIFTGKA